LSALTFVREVIAYVNGGGNEYSIWYRRGEEFSEKQRRSAVFIVLGFGNKNYVDWARLYSHRLYFFIFFYDIILKEKHDLMHTLNNTHPKKKKT
jgi:hypothetical protein